MKTLIASFIALAPALMLVQPVAAKEQAKPAAAKKATAAKSTTAKKPATTKKTTAKKPAAGKAAVAAGAGAATAVVAGAALSPDALALSDRVHTGRIACELGQHVNVTKDNSNPGYFYVDGNGFKYHMAPVATSTGVLRLEDKAAGAVWLQIANKSMLMNQKQGQRLADECMSNEQTQVAEAIKKNPPPSLLETPAGK